ncbi:hypothetical protein CON71_30445 [Bacillus thuringiensis]|uniref:Transposase n=1 Tax=Bacillus thuringiensis TaxID=1428 RepID=A0A9X6THJ3_BACTU|nr:hypothetical protein CON71_30445 [Bacillus thuringiensis]
MNQLEIKNKAQIKTWMKWHREGETYRFSRLVGKQYSYGKVPKELNELKQIRLENKHLKTKLLIQLNYLKIKRS